MRKSTSSTLQIMRSTFRDSTGRDNSLFSSYTFTVVIYPCMVPLFWFEKKTAITGKSLATQRSYAYKSSEVGPRI